MVLQLTRSWLDRGAAPPRLADLPRPQLPPIVVKPRRQFGRPAFFAGDSAEAKSAGARLSGHYGNHDLRSADVIVALGGDGLMLRTLHRHLSDNVPLFGMNRGSLGFLMNEFREDGLLARLRQAESSIVHPLRMVARDAAGNLHEALAINEVSLFRQTHQAGKLKVSVDGTVRLPELVCDGILLATPVGSTAYNLSVGGPILPINAPLLALTPISPFRPRRWRGAVLPDRARVTIEVLEPEKRPMAAVANHREFEAVREVTISAMCEVGIEMLFDPGHALDERILSEQFQF